MGGHVDVKSLAADRLLSSLCPGTVATQSLRKIAQSKRVELDALKLRRKGAKPEQAVAVWLPHYHLWVTLYSFTSSFPCVACSLGYLVFAQLDEQVVQAQLAYDTAMQEALATMRNVIQSVWLRCSRCRRPTAMTDHSAAVLCWRRAAASRSRWPLLRTL